ncbi:hypothetical protein E2C01_073181 [Portunus trituberculatus]|nr:hypothetical protein [Portunus trituberculatus]
MPRRILP